MLKRIFLGVFFSLYVLLTIYFISERELASLRESSLSNIIGDILFFIGVVGFFSYVFGVSILSSKIWRIIFWVYIAYLILAALFTSQDVIMIGNNGVAYSEIEEEGWTIFFMVLAIISSSIIILLYPLYKLGYTKSHKNKR